MRHGPTGAVGDGIVNELWIINHYAGGPGIGTGWRHWELARRWIRSGVRVRIFSASTTIGGQAHADRRGQRDIEGVPFHFVEAPAYWGNGVGRLQNIVAFNHRIGRSMLDVARTLGLAPDIVIASSPQPLVWPAAARVARRLGAAFVPEIRDLWPESLEQLAGMKPWHPLVAWCRWADRIGCRSAAAIVSPLANIESAIRARGHTQVPCIVVPNGVSMDEGPPPELDPDLATAIADARASGRRLMLYAGAMGVPNALDQFVEAMAGLATEERARVRVLMIGDGSERGRLEVGAHARGVPMRFMGPRAQAQVRALCRICDLGLLGWLDRPLYRHGISPQKRALMLGEGLPLLHAVPHLQVDETALGTGWSIPAGDAKALAAAIRDFLETPANRLQAMRAHCHSYAHEHLDWDRIASKAWSELQELDNRRPDS